MGGYLTVAVGFASSGSSRASTPQPTTCFEERLIPATSTLSREQLEHAFELLKEEEDHYLLTRRQRFGLTSLTVAINLFLVTVVVHVLHVAVELTLGRHWDLLDEVLTVVYVTLFAGLPILFLLSLSSIGRALGRVRLVRRLGLDALLPTPWESMGWVSRVFHALGWILVPGAVLIAILGGGLLWFFWEGGGEVVMIGLAAILFGVVVALGPFLARLRARYKAISELKEIRASMQEKLARSTGGADRVDVGSHEVKQLAAFEKAKIVRDRTEAIQMRYREPEGCTVVRSRAYKAGADELPPEDRWKLQAQVQELMFTPRPEGAQQDADGVQWAAPVPDTDLEVRYSIQEDERSIQLLSVGRRSGSAGGDPDPAAGQDDD